MKGWKTFAVNLTVALVGVAMAAVADAPIDEQTAGYVLTALGTINVGLRFVTDSPVFKASAAPE